MASWPGWWLMRMRTWSWDLESNGKFAVLIPLGIAVEQRGGRGDGAGIPPVSSLLMEVSVSIVHFILNPVYFGWKGITEDHFQIGRKMEERCGKQGQEDVRARTWQGVHISLKPLQPPPWPLPLMDSWNYRFLYSLQMGSNPPGDEIETISKNSVFKNWH